VVALGAVAYLTPVQKGVSKDGISYDQVQTDNVQAKLPTVDTYRSVKVARGWCVEMVEAPNDTELANYMRATVATLE